MGNRVGCLRGIQFVVLATRPWLSSVGCRSGYFTVHDVLLPMVSVSSFAIAGLEAKEEESTFCYDFKLLLYGIVDSRSMIQSLRADLDSRR